MSGNDIRDILQVAPPSEQNTLKRARQQVKQRRPEGITRELFSLIGPDSTAALVMPTYKTKVKKKATPWSWRSFTIPGRSDGFSLSCWVKRTKGPIENPFDMKVAKIDIPEYTNDEYENHLKSLDADWTKEETDYMFCLCKRFALRFPVIADRYAYGDKHRTIEDIKDRYYSLYRTWLVRCHGKTEEEVSKKYSYDKKHEIDRKRALERLAKRTQEEVEAEEQNEVLTAEKARIKQNEEILARERDHVEQLLSQLRASRTGPEPKRRKKSVGAAAAMAAAAMEVTHEKLIPGAHVRSQMLPPPKGNLPKLSKAMSILDVSPKPVMPTSRVCHKFEHLQSSLAVLFELKKVVDKMEVEHKIRQSLQPAEEAVIGGGGEHA
ncbi:hypothetical protein BCR43DRAFT_512403 [Syncephalastrum racemosum]|uniref:SWR1-complex protein 4 n=1 Tax=Syncephalastrum racemosum TaxID=13706 RepID=A0A1X2HQA1_SYNRA|nr:hypothetical protein BCR43DRAFT_512403 [Syncephalastrum racemosum]